MTAALRCYICDLVISNPSDARETFCRRYRHATCGLLTNAAQLLSCDCATCEKSAEDCRDAWRDAVLAAESAR